MLEQWEEKYQNRFNWAYEALNCFLDSLSTNIRRKTSKKGVTIAVYGNSQVGKTSLILKLIGISDERYDELYRILRCDIPRGHSVTATSMVYRKAEDNNFHIKLFNSPSIQVTSEKLQDELKKIRANVESNQIRFDDEKQNSNIQIDIPAYYFKNIDYDFTIIDLPGINSSNRKEHNHVEFVIKRIVPAASLVLLVCDKISDFSPENIQLSEIKKWYREPDRFRLILTRSVSANSVRNSIKNNFSYDDYIRYYCEQFEHTLNPKGSKQIEEPIFDKKSTKFYPLEYGESFQQLKQDDRVVFDNSKAFIDKLIQELIIDIKENATDYKILLRMTNYSNIIEKDIVDQIFEIEKKKEAINKSSKNLEEEKEIRKGFKKIKNEEIGKLENQIKILQNVKKLPIELDKEKVHPIQLESNKTNVKYFRIAIYQFNKTSTESINKQIDILKTDHNVNIDLQLVAKKIESIVDESFRSIRNIVNDYTLDEYYPSFSSDFDTDRRNLQRNSEDAIKALKQMLSEAIHIAFDAKIKDLQSKIEKSKYESINAEAKINKLNETLKDNNSEINKLTKIKSKIEKDSKVDKERCDIFFRIFLDKFLHAYNKQIDCINDCVIEDKLLNFLETYLIASEMEKLEHEHNFLKHPT